MRLAFVLRGRHPGRVELTGRVLDVRLEATARRAMIRWDAMFSHEGVGPLIDLVERTVSPEGFDPDRLVETRSGGYYHRELKSAADQRRRTDRRVVPRTRVKTPGQAEVRGLRYRVTVRNLSPSGLLIECDKALRRLPAEFLLHLSLPTTGERLEVSLVCGVVWSDQQDVLIAGVQILMVADDAEQDWWQYVARRAYGQVMAEPTEPILRPIKEVLIL